MHVRKLAALALLMPAFAQAADMGIGTTVTNSGGALYVPIALSETLRLEPFGGFSRNEDDVADVTFTTVTLGVGAFRLMPLGEHAQSYCGGRASYGRQEIDGGLIGDSTEDGIALEAVLGGEVFLFPQLSLSVEGYAYAQDFDGGTGYGTGSRFVARAFFK